MCLLTVHPSVFQGSECICTMLPLPPLSLNIRRGSSLVFLTLPPVSTPHHSPNNHKHLLPHLIKTTRLLCSPFLPSLLLLSPRFPSASFLLGWPLAEEKEDNHYCLLTYLPTYLPNARSRFSPLDSRHPPILYPLGRKELSENSRRTDSPWFATPRLRNTIPIN
ncbi:hypothetical protein LY76DRAFT_31944 [Colletotrichum caudatum]|nr:hypothetical protein LY76DRAFT_31944 [Colletotrichum caudatum]